ECLPRDDRRALRHQAHRESLQVPALEPPVLACGELGTRFDRHDSREKRGIGPGLRPYADAAADGKKRETLLRNFHAQVGRFDLDRQNGIARLDPLAFSMVAGQDGAGRRGSQHSLFLEATHLVLARRELLILSIQLLFLFLARPYLRLRTLALMTERFGIRRGRDTVGGRLADARFVGRALRQIRLELFDVLEPRRVTTANFLSLALEIACVFGESGLLDPRYDGSGGHRLPLVGNAADEPSASGE